jgi:hypothetical protein
MGDFNATLHSTRFLRNLDRNTVAREITNDDYDVVGARTVEVHRFADLSAQDANADGSVQIQNPGGSTVSLTMDQEKDLTVGIPSVEEVQSQPDLQQKARERQAQAGEEDLDDFVLGMYGSAGNSVATTATTPEGFVKNGLRKAKVKLSDDNVPRRGRFAVLSPAFMDLVTEYAGDRITRNEEIETEGYIGRYQGFDLFESSAITKSSGKRKMIAGHRAAITMAVQLNNVALVPNGRQAKFHGDVLKSLMVYGAEVFLPDALCLIDADAIT